jgi:hypothetical protein
VQTLSSRRKGGNTYTAMGQRGDHFSSTFTTSPSVRYSCSPDDASSTAQHPWSNLTNFPTCPIQRYPTTTTLFPSTGAQGTRWKGLMEIWDALPLWMIDTTTLFGSGWIFCLAAGTVFAVWPSNLTCGDDAGRPRI